MSSDDFTTRRMTRAEVLRRAAAMGVGVSSLGILGACGNNSTAPGGTSGGSAATGGPPAAADVKGNIVLLNYPGWIGPHTVSGFERKYPGTKVKETASGFESLSGVAQSVAQNPQAYDVMLATVDQCQQLELGGFVLKVSDQEVPNRKNIDERFRKLYPWGDALDTGAIGIGYRKDMVKEPVRSWGDFWKLVPKYSKKVVMNGVDRDALGSALIYLGKDGNSTNSADLEAAKKALLELKPHARAFKVTDIAKSLLDGTAALTMGYNYETAAAALKNPNIEFVVPEEGLMGYVEGFVGLSKTDNAPTVKAFLNYVAQPKVLAAHTNATLAGHVSEAARPYIDKGLLGPAFELPKNTTMIGFLGEDGIKLWNKIWSEFQAA